MKLHYEKKIVLNSVFTLRSQLNIVIGMVRIIKTRFDLCLSIEVTFLPIWCLAHLDVSMGFHVI